MSKRKAVTVIAVLALIVAGIAGAWYAASGSSASTKTAQAGNAPVPVIVSVDTGSTELYPGDDAAGFTGAVTRGAHNAHVGSVSAALDSAGLPAGCLASWFLVSASLDGPGKTLTLADPSAAFSGSVTFTDVDTDQSACSAADLKVIVTAHPNP